MEWIKTILPLLGVALGFVLAESGKLFSDKRNDKRKLKKLLFFLLELRYHFAKELSIEEGLEKALFVMRDKVAQKLGVDKNDSNLINEINNSKPFLKTLISKFKVQDEQYIKLSENIDTVLTDLAEIFPILAYELNGEHNIKERLNKFDSYFSDMESFAGEAPFDVKQWMNPKLTKRLLENLDNSIVKISAKIDKKTREDSETAISNMDFEDDNKDFEAFFDEFLNQF